MGKNITIAILSILLVMFLIRDNITYSEMQQLEAEVSLLNERSHSKSYSEGYRDGEEDGYDSGYDTGYDEGYSEGLSEGEYEGNQTGYTEGTVNSCLYYKDVNRAFRIALDTNAWFAFVEAYDLYISDIIPDNDPDKLYDILMSLILIDKGKTYELSQADKDLLIATFGKELFIENGLYLD